MHYSLLHPDVLPANPSASAQQKHCVWNAKRFDLQLPKAIVKSATAAPGMRTTIMPPQRPAQTQPKQRPVFTKRPQERSKMQVIDARDSLALAQRQAQEEEERKKRIEEAAEDERQRKKREREEQIQARKAAKEAKAEERLAGKRRKAESSTASAAATPANVLPVVNPLAAPAGAPAAQIWPQAAPATMVSSASMLEQALQGRFSSAASSVPFTMLPTVQGTAGLTSHASGGGGGLTSFMPQMPTAMSSMSGVPSSMPSGAMPATLIAPSAISGLTPAATSSDAAAAAAAPVDAVTAAIGQSNALSAENRLLVERFLGGQRSDELAVNGVREVVLNEEIKEETGQRMKEQIIFEMNYTTGQWRKLRRRRRIM
eukprot:TRINITY_DN2640_c0_g1_i11.p2 TRINITY_DN2640_c0_g1~~TRINITY_DN2640_c0_g1_i11.p2  ORF type:complete len:372 (+),score=117.97 TRINITY_DN2640_c0_g1_i11:464-1579(+)